MMRRLSGAVGAALGSSKVSAATTSSSAGGQLQPPLDSATSLTFQILTDVHLEFTRGKFPVPERKAPFLALLGDIGAHGVDGEGMTHIKKFVHACLTDGGFQQLWYVMGNHEGYGSSLEAVRNELLALEKEVGRDKFALLDRSYVDIPLPPDTTGDDDAPPPQFAHGQRVIRVLGATMWSRIPEKYKPQVSQSLNDFRQIQGMTIDKMDELHKGDLAWLHDQCRVVQLENEKALTAGEAGRTSSTDGHITTTSPSPIFGTVILTHHCPFTDAPVMLPPHDKKAIRFCIEWGVGGADLVPKEFSQRRYPGLGLWCYGHTHWNHPMTTYEGLSIGTNQVGYPGGGDHVPSWKDHQPSKIFSVAVYRRGEEAKGWVQTRVSEHIAS